MPSGGYYIIYYRVYRQYNDYQAALHPGCWPADTEAPASKEFIIAASLVVDGSLVAARKIYHSQNRKRAFSLYG